MIFVFISLFLTPFAAGAETYLLERDTPVTFTIVPQGSTIAFHARSTGHSFSGVTNHLEGTITFVPARIEEAFRTEIEIDAASLDTDNKARNKKMRKKYLETEKFPKISFVGDHFKVLDKGISQGVIRGIVSGGVTVHGVTRWIDLEVFGKIEGDAIKVRGEVPLKITSFGIPLPKMFFIKVKDDIRVDFEITAKGKGI